MEVAKGWRWPAPPPRLSLPPSTASMAAHPSQSQRNPSRALPTGGKPERAGVRTAPSPLGGGGSWTGGRGPGGKWNWALLCENPRSFPWEKNASPQSDRLRNISFKLDRTTKEKRWEGTKGGKFFQKSQSWLYPAATHSASSKTTPL